MPSDHKGQISQFRQGEMIDGLLTDEGCFEIHQITMPDGTVFGEMPPREPGPKVTVRDVVSSDPSVGPGIIVEPIQENHHA
ncbi:MAG TPA: hypothetical protein VMY37_40110 [Thermoguttaceae bacterium]|nr:hypothetical protein [Thermoguttaceae bacterium]